MEENAQEINYLYRGKIIKGEVSILQRIIMIIILYRQNVYLVKINLYTSNYEFQLGEL